ncbi:MAG: DUF4392 domain-containing protein [Hyphomicrobiaceae bacterium]
MDAAHAFDLIDRIVCTDLGGRGVTGLFPPARAMTDGPICKAAAEKLATLQRGDHVFIVTGSLTRATVRDSIAENDGPIGSAVLAYALARAGGAVPVILVDQSITPAVARMVQYAGLNVVDADQARIAAALPRFTGVAVMEHSVVDAEAAKQRARELIDTFAPKVVVACERAGMTADGTYRNALGQDYSEGREKLDFVFDEAQRRDIPTIGIGDGGNEIGMGAVKAAVHEHVPSGDVLCAELATDILIPAGVSNWGCYGIAAALAILNSDITLAHTAQREVRLIEASPLAGLVDGTTGLLDATVDGMPAEVHASVVELLSDVVRRTLA